MFEINIFHNLVDTVLIMVILAVFYVFDLCKVILVLKSIMDLLVLIFLTRTILGLKVILWTYTPC